MAAEPTSNRPGRESVPRLPEPHCRVRHLLEGDADTAHRLKNILASIMARLQLAGLDQRIPADISIELEDIARSCLDAGELVDVMKRRQGAKKTG